MKPEYSLDDLFMFWKVACNGSFRGAAAEMDIPVSTLSRRIARLEQDLGVRLLHRDAHRLQLTSAGEQYLLRCGPLFTELGQVSEGLLEEAREASGTLRITAPVNITHQWLGDLLNRFMLQYPRINLELILSNNNVDILANQIDLAIRVGDPGLDDWIARPLRQTGFLLCAGRQQTDWQQIRHPRELADLPLVIAPPVTTWQLQRQDGAENWGFTPGGNVRLAVNELDSATRAVAAGIGIGLLPCWLAQAAIQRGEIVQVLPEWRGQRRLSCLVYRDRDQQPLRLRLLIDYLMAHGRSLDDEALEKP
jgi:LysR family transcriptional regulator, transcriptional activator AphB